MTVTKLQLHEITDGESIRTAGIQSGQMIKVLGPRVKRIPMSMIIERVREVYEVTHEDIIGKSRCRDICDARFEAIYLCHQQGYSMPHIGRVFQRDHTSVLHAIRSHRKRLAEMSDARGKSGGQE